MRDDSTDEAGWPLPFNEVAFESAKSRFHSIERQFLPGISTYISVDHYVT
jgi:hypothetical protein